MESAIMARNIRDDIKKLPLVPHHEISETFADTLGPYFFDGTNLRLEFASTRLGAASGNEPTKGERHIVCRLALSAACTIDLINRMRQIATELEKASLVTKGQPAAAGELKPRPIARS